LKELYRDEACHNIVHCSIGDTLSSSSAVFTTDKYEDGADISIQGEVSAMGRSIVIFDKDRGSQRFACTNIEPDKDIIKYTNIRKPPRFVVTQFIEDVREVMGLPEWMLTVVRRGRCMEGRAFSSFFISKDL
ncbi:hypothetical protein L9F63_016823, partial [Diploptera punctata]